MLSSTFTIEKSTDVVDVTVFPSWLAPGGNGGPPVSSSPEAARKSEVRSSDLEPPPAPLPSPVGLPASWRGEVRAWPQSRRKAWADLAVQGEDEGIPLREAEELAYRIVAARSPEVFDHDLVIPRPGPEWDGWHPSQLHRDLRDVKDGSERVIPGNASRPIWLFLKNGRVVGLGDQGRTEVRRWCVEGGATWYRVPTTTGGAP